MTIQRARRVASGVVFVASLAAAFALPIHAGIDGDVRAGGYTDAEAAMIGGGALVDLDANHRWYFNPNLELVFPDDADLMTVNGDFHYDFPADRVAWWVGGGPALLFEDPDGGEDDTDLGANLLAGLGAKSGNVRPFGQVKVTLADDTEAALMVGIRF